MSRTTRRTTESVGHVGSRTTRRTTESVRHVGGLYTESGVLALCCVSRSVISDSLRPHGLQPPCSSVLRTLQARILEWVAISFFKGPSRPRDQTRVSYLAGRFFTIWATKETPIPRPWGGAEREGPAHGRWARLRGAGPPGTPGSCWSSALAAISFGAWGSPDYFCTYL